MKKLSRKEITLEPEKPTLIEVTGGIDFYDDQIKLEYPLNSHPNSITLSLTTVNGDKISHNLSLDTNSNMWLVFPDIYKDILNRYPNETLDHYDSIIFESKTKMFLSISLEKQALVS